jgi:hypothetical protein
MPTLTLPVSTLTLLVFSVRISNHLSRQVIPIGNPANSLTTIEEIAFFHQGRATNRQLTSPSLSKEGAARFKFLLLCVGGAIPAHKIRDFMVTYPEFDNTVRLPKGLMHVSITTRLPPCHCCTRTHMRKVNAPPPSSRKTGPLEGVHLDLFTYPDDPLYDTFFVHQSMHKGLLALRPAQEIRKP